MTANKTPERPFSPFLVREQMGPEAFNCRSWTAYPPEQLAEIERACYLAGIADAKAMIESMQEYKPALQKCRPAKTGYIAFMGKKSATLEGEEYGWINTGTTLANLSALEQGVGK